MLERASKPRRLIFGGRSPFRPNIWRRRNRNSLHQRKDSFDTANDGMSGDECHSIISELSCPSLTEEETYHSDDDPAQDENSMMWDIKILSGYRDDLVCQVSYGLGGYKTYNKKEIGKVIEDLLEFDGRSKFRLSQRYSRHHRIVEIVPANKILKRLQDTLELKS